MLAICNLSLRDIRVQLSLIEPSRERGGNEGIGTRIGERGGGGGGGSGGNCCHLQSIGL